MMDTSFERAGLENTRLLANDWTNFPAGFLFYLAKGSSLPLRITKPLTLFGFVPLRKT